jgi:hypothetical protein
LPTGGQGNTAHIWPLYLDKDRLIKGVDVATFSLRQESARNQLDALLNSLAGQVMKTINLTPKSIRKLIYDHQQLKSLHLLACDVTYDVAKFSLSIGPSKLTDGGNGVFVSKGSIKDGQLVALYPGTIYLPFEPILFQSVNNPFILRCFDGIHVDGKHRGLSKAIYKSCALRDTVNCQLTCDITWLTLTSPLNPLSIGQLINNHTREIIPNVEYVELDLPANWPVFYYSLVPNIEYGPLLNLQNSSRERQRRVVAICATRDIQEKEELYSSYYTVKFNSQ